MTNHFPGQEHLPPHPAAGNAGRGDLPPAPRPVPAGPDPVQRRATALKAAIDHMKGGSVASMLDAAQQIDAFLSGRMDTPTNSVVNPAGSTKAGS